MRPRSISTLTLAVPAQPKALLVIGDAALAESLAKTLEAHQFVVNHAEDLSGVRVRLERDLPDIVFLDKVQPGRSGHDICQALKEDPRTYFIPIMALSHDASPAVRLEAIKAGCDHWLPPPVDVQELIARANVLVRFASLNKAAASKTESLMLWHDWVRYLVHDLRNPVSVAIGNLAFALDESAEPSASGDIQRALEEARYELGRVSAMLQDLLDIDRLKRGVLRLQREQTDVAGLIRQTTSSVKILAEAKKIAVAVVVQGDCNLRVDPSLVQRVAANLVGNAVRYARKKTVGVHVESGGEGVTVRVSNDGPGIPSNVHARLFEPWVILDARAALSQGTGLGLAFSRMVVEAHGGKIWLDTFEEGNVTFAFRLPRSFPVS